MAIDRVVTIEEHLESAALSIQKALTIQEAHLRIVTLFEALNLCAKFYVSVPCKSLGFRWELDCGEILSTGFQSYSDDTPK